MSRYNGPLYESACSSAFVEMKGQIDCMVAVQLIGVFVVSMHRLGSPSVFYV